RAAFGDLSAEGVLRFARAARRENEWNGPNKRPVSAKTVALELDRPGTTSGARGTVARAHRIYALLACGSLALAQPATRSSARKSVELRGGETLHQTI